MLPLGQTSELNRETDKSSELEYLMRRFGNEVLKLAYFYLKDRQLAEDVAQEVFIRVYKDFDNFRSESSYFTWIYRITVNLCRDVARSWYFRRVIPWKNDLVTVLPAEPGVEVKALEKLEADNLLQAVLNLPPKYREVVVLRFYYGLSFEEVAKITGVKEGNLRVRLHRALQLLKKKLAKGGVSD